MSNFPTPDMALTYILVVPDCQSAYETLRGRGADFLTPTHLWGKEIRCFFPGPNAHLFETREIS
jgi:hypothetical protein